MAQGQAASVFVRAALTLGDEGFAEAAERAIRPLTAGDSSVVARTPEGPVLQEYPTRPPSHVLNGWIFALWGLYDVAALINGAGPSGREARRAFLEGTAALVRRVDLYDAGLGWSRYDLYPHPVVNVASTAYHALHVLQLEATNTLAPRPALSDAAARFAAYAESPVKRARAFTAKALFRVAVPRSRRMATLLPWARR